MPRRYDSAFSDDKERPSRLLPETRQERVQEKHPHFAHPGPVGEALAQLFPIPFSQRLRRLRPAFQSLPLAV